MDRSRPEIARADAICEAEVPPSERERVRAHARAKVRELEDEAAKQEWPA